MNPDDDDIMGVEPAMDAMMGMSPATWEALPQPQMPPLVPGNGATHPSLLERMDRSRGTQTSRRYVFFQKKKKFIQKNYIKTE